MKATRTSLLVKWSPPFLSDDGNDLKVRHYYIEYRMQEEFMAFSLVTAMRNETEKDLSNLQSNTTYAIRMFARSINGNGSKSDDITATTLREGMYCLSFSVNLH